MKTQRIAQSLGAGALILATGTLASTSFAGATSAKDQAPSNHAYSSKPIGPVTPC